MGKEGNSTGIEELLVRAGGIKFGSFTLASGKQSDYYVDIKEVMTEPENLEILTESIAGHVSAEAVAGVELGAVPLVVATAVKKKLPFLIIRKERNHGTKSLIIGKLTEGGRIDLIEDVVTTGSSVLKAVKLLREKGAVVEKCICVVDREDGGKELLAGEGVDLVPLIRISSVLKNRKSG